MTLDTARCEEYRRHPRFKIEDGDKSVVFINEARERLCRTRIDDCVVTAGIRADWVVSHVGKWHIIVEFKGTDLNHALKQLCATGALWRKHRVKSGEMLAGLIITNRVPKAIATQDLQEEFASTMRGRLTVKNYCNDLTFAPENLLGKISKPPGAFDTSTATSEKRRSNKITRIRHRK